MQLKNGIVEVELRFDSFKNQIALAALHFIAFKKLCAFLRCASVHSEKMPTSDIAYHYNTTKMIMNKFQKDVETWSHEETSRLLVQMASVENKHDNFNILWTRIL